MLYIEENAIYITQNDDVALDINMTLEDGSQYQMTENETLTMTVRKLPEETSDVLIAINSIAGSNRIVIQGIDTQNVPPGQYSMDIQLNRENNTKYTIIPNNVPVSERHKVKNWKNFVVMPEVTRT